MSGWLEGDRPVSVPALPAALDDEQLAACVEEAKGRGLDRYFVVGQVNANTGETRWQFTEPFPAGWVPLYRQREDA